jgi:hypothetical protein
VRTDARSAWRRGFTLALCLLGLSLVPSLRGVAHAQEVPAATPQRPAEPPPPPEPTELCGHHEEAEPESGSWIGAGFTAGLLNLPKLGIGVEVIGELRVPNMWPIELSATYWFENDAVLNATELDLAANPFIYAPYPPGGSRLEVTEMQASAALCPFEYNLETGSFMACGGVSAGALRASGEGFVNQKAVTRPLFDFDAYARWHFRLGAGIGITYSAGLFIPLFRDHFGYMDRAGDFHQSFRIAPIGGRLDLALTYGF